MFLSLSLCLFDRIIRIILMEQVQLDPMRLG